MPPSDYPRRALNITSAAPVVAAFSRVGVGMAGALGDPQYWSHAEGRWTAAPFDPAVHLKPLPKPHAHDATVNLLAVPFAVLADPDSAAHLYLDDGAGGMGAKYQDIDNAIIQGYLTGALSA